MKKLLAVARREFTATVFTKGFLLGVVFMPLVMFVGIVLVPLLVSSKPPKISGTIAIIDRSGGTVSPILQPLLSPEELTKDQDERRAQVAEATGRLTEKMAGPESGGNAKALAQMAAAAAIGNAPDLKFESLSSAADPEAEKAKLREGAITDGGRLMLIVIEPTAVVKGEQPEFGAYQAFVRPRLDERVQRLVLDKVRRSIRDARLNANGMDPKVVNGLVKVADVMPVTVTQSGERASVGGAQFFVPMGFMMLLWVSAFTGGQYLLTTTIEEKSNRIMEVLLSAASPLELMVGKIIGQMGVGLLILLAYSTLGGGALYSFKLMDILDWHNIGYLIVYFFIAFFLIASLMAAVGSAVTEVHEAQSLVGPIMMVLVTPMLLMPAVITNPNSMMATVLGFVPPISPFMMVLRIAASTEPLPWWQIAGSIAVGLISVCFAAWAAAKIFRIGVLMYGKPPNFATLIKWIRMA